jgi:subtilisin family serine protease
MSNQRKPSSLPTWQRLAFGSLLCASLSHCADAEPSGEASSAQLPSESTNGTDGAPGKAQTSVQAAAGVIKAPQGANLQTVRRWFVELEGVPLVEGGDLAALDEGLDRFRKEAYESGLPYQEHMRFDGIIHGVSVSLDYRDLGKLSTLEGVKAVYPVGITKQPEFKRGGTLSPNLKSAVSMTGADVVRTELGFDGTGIRVGIIDSGIDVQHPDFHVGGTLAGASRIDLTRSHDFVGDDYDAGDPTKPPVPDDDPDDCGGHGTHVAGIIGASGNPATGGAVGVAPGVTLQSYRVFGCNGSVSNDIITQAIERAYTDGADVINLSLGSNSGWAEDFYSVALSRVLALGVVPVAAQGNEGETGAWSAGAPGVGADVVTVASVDNVKLHWQTLKLDDASVVRYSLLSGSPYTPESGSIGPVVYVGQGCPADPTTGLPEDEYLADPNGKVALITRGVCFFSDKYERAVAAGATLVLVEQSEAHADEPPSGFQLTDDPDFPTPVPAIFISREDGAKIKALIAGAGTSVTFTPDLLEEENPTGGLVSGFSSWGLTNELLLKPDVAAPGGRIRSTWPLSRNDGDSPGYATLDGTSMATPHVTGAIALLLQAQPSLPLTRVRTLLQNSAEPVLADPEDTTVLDGAHHQGAGLLHIDRAIKATTVVSPAKIEAGEGEAGPFDAVLYVENLSDQDATYQLGTLAHALATWGTPDDPGFAPYALNMAPAHAKVEFRAGDSLQKVTSLTVPAHKVRTLSVTITAPTKTDAAEGEEPELLPDGAIYGGFITLTPEDGSHATKVTVPYAGVVGDYQAIDPLSYPVLESDDPLVILADASLGAQVDAPFVKDDVAEPYHVFSMKEGDVPTAALRLAHGVDKITMYLVPHGDSAWLGTIKGSELTYMPRNDIGTYVETTLALSDFGAGKLPDGVYHLKVTMLKALGNPKDPSHVITLESLPFRIDRTAEPPEEGEGG